MNFLDEVKFRWPDGTCTRAWFYHDVGDAKILLVERGPRQATVEIGQDWDADGIFQPATNFSLTEEEERSVALAKQFVEEALKPEEPK